MPLKLAALALLQTVDPTTPTIERDPPSIGRELSDISLSVLGEISCDRGIARRQSAELSRRFGRRKDRLIRRWESIYGPDPGFDMIAILRCRIPDRRMAEHFDRAMQSYSRNLRVLETRYGTR